MPGPRSLPGPLLLSVTLSLAVLAYPHMANMPVDCEGEDTSDKVLLGDYIVELYPRVSVHDKSTQ